jgi:hypothetical protein
MSALKIFTILARIAMGPPCGYDGYVHPSEMRFAVTPYIS